MIIVSYSPIGNPVNDFFLDGEIKIVKDVISAFEDYTLYYSTENIFVRIRLEIVLGNIDSTNIQFEYDFKPVHVNRFGAIIDWPNGFCDIVIDMSEKILRNALAKKKSERNIINEN